MRRRILISLLALVIVAGGSILVGEFVGPSLIQAGTAEVAAGEPALLARENRPPVDPARTEAVTRGHDRGEASTDTDTGPTELELAGMADVPPETTKARWAEVPGGTWGVFLPTTLGGEFTVMPGSSTAPHAATATVVHSISVEVEDGLAVDVEEFGEFILATLNDERSWAAEGIAFNRVEDGADFRVMLASADTTDALCAPLKTNGKWSCGRYLKTVLNADRWVNGADAFADAGGSPVDYRRYLINHEMGHLLGRQHATCTGAGDRADVMVQQSITLGGCTPNGWPHP